MKRPTLVLLPVPSQGHLISMLEMARRLLRIRRLDFSLTVLLVPMTAMPLDHAMTTSYIQDMASSGIHVIFEELTSSETAIEHHAGAGLAASISLPVEEHREQIKAAISKRMSSARVVGLVVDFFATTAIDVADELGIPTYLYFTSCAAMLALLLHLPSLKLRIPLNTNAEGKVVRVPGIQATPYRSMPLFATRSNSDSYDWFLYHGKRFRETKGMIVNSFMELEHKAIKAIADNPTPPIYAVGPVLNPGDVRRVVQHECVNWLDKQPKGSVVFLCFGSMGRFSPPQMKEIAVGLERSGHRFLWSARMSSSEEARSDEVFPEGFLERTKERGKVWASSVPQVEILSHEAVGGFVTHGGWNSCLESLWFGVPMIAWPLYAEQHFNAFQMGKELGVAVELVVERERDNFVSATELEKGLRCLMESDEGEKVRATCREMRDASRKAVSEGGSSYDSLQQLVQEMTSLN